MKAFLILFGVFISVGVTFVSSSTLKLPGEDKRLIKTSKESPGVWMNEKEIFSLIRNGQTFMDITDFDYSDVVKTKTRVTAIPTQLRFQETVKKLADTTDNARVLDFVRHFSSYHNRFYTSSTGRNSQRWLLSEVQSSLQNYAGNSIVSEVDHGYLQRSIVARLQGANTALSGEVVIIGAHLDSVNKNGPTLNAPGADDNASGSVVLLETLRAIVQSGLIFQRTVEFHWYAAEEIGLRGSQAIAEEYRNTNVNAVGMLNLDVVGYHLNGVDEIGIFTDNNEHPALVQFLRQLTDEYLLYRRRDRACGYGCSDHASWTNNGFPAAMAAEATSHPHMHTVHDIIQNMSFEQVNEFIKLAIGFVVEMAEPQNA